MKSNYNELVNQKSFEDGFKELEALFSQAIKQLKEFQNSVKAAGAENQKVISKFTNEIQKSRKLLSETPPETAKGKKKIEEYGEAIEGLGKKINETRKANDNLNESQKAAADSIEGIKARIKTLKSEYDNLSQSQDPKRANELRSSLQILGAELKRLQDSTKQTNNTLRGINETIEFQANTYGDVRKKIKLLKEQLQDAEIGSRSYLKIEAALNNELQREIEIREKQPSLLAKRIAQAAGESKEVQRLSDKLSKLRKELASTEDVKVFDKIRSEIQKTEKQISDTLEKQKTKGGGLFSGLKDAFAFGGAAGAAQAGVDLAIQAIGDFVEETKELKKQLLDIESIVGRTGENRNELAASLRATSATFGVEVNDLLNAANVLAKETGISVTQAVQEINKGFAQGANVTGDFLTQIKEYPAQLAQIGLSASDIIKASTLQVQEGIFDDKLIDTLKEGALRLGDLTPAQKKTLLDTFGDLGDEILQQFQSGDRFGAIQKVAKGITDLEKAGKNATPIIANLFGGAGEDLGVRGFELIATFDEIELKLTKAQQAQLNLNEAQREFEESFVSLANEFSSEGKELEIFFLKIKKAVLDLIIDFVRFAKEVGRQTKPIIDFFFEAESAGNILSGVFDFLFKGVKALGGAILNVIDGIKVFIAFGVALYRSFEGPIKELRSGFSELGKFIKGIGTDIGDFFKNTFQVSFTSVSDFVLSTVQATVNGINSLGKAANSFLKKLGVSFRLSENFGKEFVEDFRETLRKLQAEDVVKDVEETAERTGEKAGKSFSKGFASGAGGALKKDVESEIKKAAEVIELKAKLNLDFEDLKKAVDLKELSKQVNESLKNQKITVLDEFKVLRKATDAEVEAAKRKIEEQEKRVQLFSEFADVIQSNLEERIRKSEEGLEGRALQKERLRNDLKLIVLAAVRNSVQNGKTLSEAFTESSPAVLGALLNSLPGFRTGGKVEGVGHGTSDSIIAKISKGEFVVNAESTSRSGKLLESINDGQITDKEFLSTKATKQVVEVKQDFDYKKLGKVIAENVPKTDIFSQADEMIVRLKDNAKETQIRIKDRLNRLPKI